MPAPKTEVLIIGSGAGGGFAAAYLAKRGVDVTLLERGPWFDYSSDFPARHRDWELRADPFSVGGLLTDPTIVATAGASIKKENAKLCSRSSLDKVRPVSRRNPFFYHRVFGVGGSTLHYEGEAHRFAPHAFAPLSALGAGIDWPITHEQLIPWYTLAESMLGVAGTLNNLFKPTRNAFPTSAHPLSSRGEWVQRGAERLGWSLYENSLALPSNSFDGRTPCQRSGLCRMGCPFGAKSSVDLAVLKPALQTGHLKILDRARALNIETDSSGRVSGVVFRRNGVDEVYRANKYILSAGAIETPRLMLISQGGKYQNGLGNSTDQVGRNLMETIFVSLSIEADRDIRAWMGPMLDGRIWDFCQPRADLGINGFTISSSGSLGGYHGPRSYAQRIRGFGRAHKQMMRDRFGRIFSLTAVTDHTPDSRNRLVLSKKLDPDGIAKVSVRTDYQQRDLNTIEVIINKLIQLADACGAITDHGLYSSYSQPSTTHIAGTCMMGDDPETSVTDRNGRVHGIENLLIADGSVLPGQGMGDSPSLTIQAIALMVASNISG